MTSQYEVLVAAVTLRRVTRELKVLFQLCSFTNGLPVHLGSELTLVEDERVVVELSCLPRKWCHTMRSKQVTAMRLFHDIASAEQHLQETTQGEELQGYTFPAALAVSFFLCPLPCIGSPWCTRWRTEEHLDGKTISIHSKVT